MSYFSLLSAVVIMLYASSVMSSSIFRSDGSHAYHNPLLTSEMPVELIATEAKGNSALYNHIQGASSTRNKRFAEEWDDPRFLSSAFGKRSGMMEFDDPRFLSSAFGKRNHLLGFDDPRFFSSSYGKRAFVELQKRYGAAFDDPRFLSSAFGKK